MPTGPTEPADVPAPTGTASPADRSHVPGLDVVARVWHELSDEPINAIAFDGPGCECRPKARQAHQVINLLYGPPAPEPEGLGAVVTNPVTGGVWVRAAHPALPWRDPAAASPQEWADPTNEDWFTFDELPQPIVQQNPGWTPPSSVGGNQ